MTKTAQVNQSVNISISEIYKVVDIPDGFESAGEFRIPRDGESYLAVDKCNRVDSKLADLPIYGPRLILVKSKRGRKVTFTYVRTGSPKYGDFYTHKSSKSISFIQATGTSCDYSPQCDIYKAEESYE